MPEPDYGRNADLAAERDAILALPPDQMQQALLAFSQRRSGVPEIPGGYRNAEFAADLPAPTGRFAANIVPGGNAGADVSAKSGETTTPAATGAGFTTSPPESGSYAAAMRAIGAMPEPIRGLAEQGITNRQRLDELAQQQGQTEQRVRTAQARGEADAQRTFAEAQRTAAEQNAPRPIPAFVPTQDTAADMGTLFSLLAVAGQALGGKGKTGAMAAMASMTGMLNGWRQGRQDLYEKERRNFDASLRQIQAQNQALQEAYRRAQETARTDMESARSQLQIELTRLGAPLVSIAAERAGLEGGSQQLQQLMQVTSQVMARKDALQARAEQAALQLANQQPIVVPGEREGTFVYARRDGTPILNPQGQPLQAPPPRSAGTAAGDRFGFGDIVVGAANEAAASLRNLTSMGAEASTGLFQGRNTTGLMTAPLGALTNALTSDEAQRYNVEIANFGKFLSQVQRGGRTVPVSDIEASQRVFAVREGDSQHTVLTKFAAMRQQLERIIEVRIASPNTPEPLKEILRQNLETIQDVVPFTVEDVNRFVNSANQTTTFSDMFRDVGIVPPAPGEQRPPPRRETPAPVPAPAAAPAAAPTSSAGPAEGTIAENPQTGERMIRRNGRWEKMQ